MYMPLITGSLTVGSTILSPPSPHSGLDLAYISIPDFPSVGSQGTPFTCFKYSPSQRESSAFLHKVLTFVAPCSVGIMISPSSTLTPTNDAESPHLDSAQSLPIESGFR